MGLENPIHIIIILAVVFMLFGAKRLPEMGRGLGDGLRGFKEAMSGQAPADPAPAAWTPSLEPAAPQVDPAIAAPEVDRVPTGAGVEHS